VRGMSEAKGSGEMSDLEPPYLRSHIDGPILVMRSGGHKWLTIRERIALFIGLTTLDDLEWKHWETPDYVSGNGWDAPMMPPDRLTIQREKK